MADLMVAGSILNAALNVLFDRLASRQVVDFFRREKLDEGLLYKFKMLLLAVSALLNDAELKEFSNLSVKLWLDELKHAIYDAKDWERILKSEIWESSSVGNSNNILPVLKLSYHYLPSYLKQCFAYCSIFPQDHKFVKNELILLWMAEGFLVDKDNNMEELGERYFDELVSRSFFQKTSGDFVMHDLMNDLAQYVSGDFSLAFQRSESHQVSDKVRHFSYSWEQCDVLNKIKPIVEATNLRTFLSVGFQGSYTSYLSSSAKLLSDLLPKLGCVRVLSFFGYDQDFELPDSICSLVHLRYLNLSHTTLKSLPDTVCRLYNLQTLLLRNCYDFIQLPTNLGELVNLRHLDISGTVLNKMPPRIINLESLQTLSYFLVGENSCSGLGELKKLSHLKGSLSIERLENIKNVEDVVEANLKGKMGIEQLSFEWNGETENSKNVESILDKLQPSANLSHLTLNNYGGTRLSNWLGDGSLFNLTYLEISDCIHCLSLPSLGQLPSLKELYIRGLTSLTRVGVEFYKNRLSSIMPFQKLLILEFHKMSEWEDWSTLGDGDTDDFPNLEKLFIVKCPKLRGNLPNLLPSLQKLVIFKCSELTAIIPGAASLQSLKLRCKNILFENNTSLKFLKSLEMDGLESNSFPCGMIESYNNLEELKIVDWSSLMHLSDDALPTTLRSLEIESCNNFEFLPKETFHNYKYLERLTLRSFDSITSFPLGLFPNLKHLRISGCKNLESFSIAANHHENLKSLQTLYIYGCENLIDFPRGGLLASNLKSLSIGDCNNLKSLPEGMKTQLTSLESLSIISCEEVESLFPAGGLPSNLRSLFIKGCKKMMAKRREWDLQNHLLFLTSLEIDCCEEIESFPEADCQLPISLTSLSLWDLRNLERIDASRLLNLSALRTFKIDICPKVKFDPKPRNTQHLPTSFRKLEIHDCPLLAKQLRTMKRDLIPDLVIDFEVFYE